MCIVSSSAASTRFVVKVCLLPSDRFPCSYHVLRSTQGTQGFSTPVDQQFLLLDPESSMLVDEDSRSPAPSPKKRHRRVSMQGASTCIRAHARPSMQQ